MVVQEAEVSQRPLQEVSICKDVSPGQRIALFVETISDVDRPNIALVAFKFLDADGELVDVENWTHWSEAAGHYVYLSPSIGGKPVQDQLILEVPPNAVKFEAAGRQWKKGTQTTVLGDLLFQDISEGVHAFRYPSGKPAIVSSNEFVQKIPVDALEKELALSVTYVPGETQKSVVPLRVKFKDADGAELLGYADLSQNPRFGSFVGLPAGPNVETRLECRLMVPPGATSLEVAGFEWGQAQADIVGPIVRADADQDPFDIEKFIDDLGSSTPLLIIDTTAPPLGHETLSLRPNNLSAAYTRLGIGVVFVPFGSLQGYPAKVNDRLAQVPRSDFDKLLEVAINARDPKTSTFVCSSFPSIQSVTAVQRLKSAGWNTVYECRDDMEEFNRVGYSKWYDPQLERQMLRMVQTVVSVSTALDAKLLSLYPKLERHFIIPNAVNARVIDSAQSLRTSEVTTGRNGSRKVGYVGHLTKSWFDWPLLIEGARCLPEVTFEIVGHGIPENLTLPENVTYLGAMSHDELRPIVKSWKVGLIPFADIPLTRSVDPNKIYEYFAWGLRCVTAPMGKVETYPSTWVYRGIDEFVECVQSALESDLTNAEIETLNQFLETASWDNRAREMVEVMNLRTTTS